MKHFTSGLRLRKYRKFYMCVSQCIKTRRKSLHVYKTVNPVPDLDRIGPRLGEYRTFYKSNS